LLAKRFNTLTAFRESERAGYKLLPFRFTALDSSRYVLSNMAGEYRVVRRDIIEALVNHQLPAGSDTYDDLKSGHFLYDADSNVALELLGLKYRTKLSRIAEFTGLHMFVVTLRCDYTCQYCQVSRQTQDRVAFDMSSQIAERAVDLVFHSPSWGLKIEFQGGEPLLNFDGIRSVVALAEARNLSEQRDLQFVIASNLSMLSDSRLSGEILDFCDAHQVFFSTSLDGPEDLHNRNRPRPGKDGYARTVAGIRRVRERLGVDRVSALMTTTEASFGRAREIIDEYVSQGFRSIFLRPLSPYGFAARAGHFARYDAERWLDFYKEGLAYILELNRQGYPLMETFSAIVLRKMLTPQNPGYIDLQSPAGTGISAIVYNYDGDVYAADEARMLAEMGDKTFRLGNVLTDDHQALMLSDALLNPLEATVAQSVPICSECAFLPYCGADPLYHHATQGDAVGNRITSGFCHRNIGIFRHLITLMEDSPQDRETLLRWAWGR
jgi:His-Xaa-Ser system radical SAM maturase HxsB